MSASTTTYSVAKHLIEMIDNMDYQYHYDVFNILCKHNMTYSRNSNGFFFDFENLGDNVVKELSEYVSSVNTTTAAAMSSSSASSQAIPGSVCWDDSRKFTNDVTSCGGRKMKRNTCHDASASSSTSTKTAASKKAATLTEECIEILSRLNISENVDVAPLIGFLEREKVTSKKTSCNKFTLAKKKFGKPVIVDLKYTFNDVLC